MVFAIIGIIMKYLIFEGMSSVGKTGAIVRLANHLVGRDFTRISGDEIPSPAENKDFRCILQNIEERVVAICSASDDKNIIKENREFLEKSAKKIDFTIMSCREEQYLHDCLYNNFKIVDTDVVLTIPLAKITRRKEGKLRSIKWYQSLIGSLSVYLFNKLYAE